MLALKVCSTNTQNMLEVRQALKQAGPRAVQHSACQSPGAATGQAGLKLCSAVLVSSQRR